LNGEILELFPPRPAPAAELRKRRVPEEFLLTPRLRRFAEAGGLDAEYEFARFKDYYRGTGDVRADWPATFRTWCRNAFELRARRERRL
jgi:hypothetical protein